MIAYSIDASQRYEYNVTKQTNKGNWINLKISQVSGVYEIRIDYTLVYNKTITFPKSWTNVNLITGNTGEKENTSTVVYYRDFKINTCKVRGKKRTN